MRSCLAPLGLALGLALGLSLVLVAAPAVLHADEPADEDSGDPRDAWRPYVGLNATGLLPTFDVDDPGFDPDEDAAPGFAVRVGYQLGRYFAVEAHYEYVGDIEIKGVTQTGEISGNVVTANVRLVIPTVTDASLYLLGGIGAAEYTVHNSVGTFTFSGSEWELSGRAGGGIEYPLTHHVYVNLEATAIFSEQRLFREVVPLVSVGGGLQYRF